jgi:hypothetical protein
MSLMGIEPMTFCYEQNIIPLNYRFNYLPYGNCIHIFDLRNRCPNLLDEEIDTARNNTLTRRNYQNTT